MTVSRMLMVGVVSASVLLPIGCDDSGKQPPAPAKADHGHAHGPDGEQTPTHTANAAGHGGPVIALGTATAGPFTVVATRDAGTIEAGKDAPIDVTVTPTAGGPAKPTAVRFWIGTEDAKGSVKAKAAVENPSEPNRWHTHAEVPSTLPTDAKLWIEIEADGGTKSVTSLDLKR